MLFNNVVLRRISTLHDTPIFHEFFFVLSRHFMVLLRLLSLHLVFLSPLLLPPSIN